MNQSLQLNYQSFQFPVLHKQYDISKNLQWKVYEQSN